MTSTTTSTESRALSLLGQGMSAEVVASAVGVSPSRISQLLSDPNFAAEVATLRYENLAKHNQRDNKYDQIEDELVDRMKELLPMMFDPMKILAAIKVINGAQRRGSSAPEAVIGQQNVVQLVMPTQIINSYTTHNSLSLNLNNQVVRAGDTDLITVQSGAMDRLLKASKENDHVKLINSSGT